MHSLKHVMVLMIDLFLPGFTAGKKYFGFFTHIDIRQRDNNILKKPDVKAILIVKGVGAGRRPKFFKVWGQLAPGKVGQVGKTLLIASYAAEFSEQFLHFSLKVFLLSRN